MQRVQDGSNFFLPLPHARCMTRGCCIRVEGMLRAPVGLCLCPAMAQHSTPQHRQLLTVESDRRTRRMKGADAWISET